MTRDELCESFRDTGGLDDLQSMSCAGNHVVLGVRPPLTNPFACLFVERQRRASHHEEHRLPDLCCSARIELPRSDARQLGLKERGRIRLRLFSSTGNREVAMWPPPRSEHDAEEAIDRASAISPAA